MLIDSRDLISWPGRVDTPLSILAIDQQDNLVISSPGGLIINASPTSSQNSIMPPFFASNGATVARTVNARAADIFNVCDFGAKHDGITDDGNAIRTCVALAGIVGAAVYMPAGVYRYTGAYTVMKSGVRIFGDGSTSTIIKPDTLGGNTDGTRVIFVNTNRDTLGLFTSTPNIPANQTDSNLSISGIGFDLSNCNTPTTSLAIASFLLATNINIWDIRADNHSASSAKGWSGFQFCGCDSYSVDGFFGRHCVNGIDNWKGPSRAKFSNIFLETADAAGNGGAINWQAIGTLKNDFDSNDDLQVSNTTIWLNNGSIGFFLDPDGGGSTSQNIQLNNIHISARTGVFPLENQGIIIRGQCNRLRARGLSFNAQPGADLRPMNIGAFFDGTAELTGTNLITTTNGSSQITVSYTGGANSGPGNWMRIYTSPGVPVTGNGLSLNGYYEIVSVSGPVTSVSSGDTFVVETGQVANASGTLSGTTVLAGYWGAPASFDISGITIDGCSAFGTDLINIEGTGHSISGVQVTTNYNGSTTPQYRSIIALSTQLTHGVTIQRSTINNIIGDAGTIALQAGWHGDNTVTWVGTQPLTNYAGTSSVDHVTSNIDATIGTTQTNYLTLQGRATGFPPRILAQGADTNVSLGLHWQGPTGNIQMQDDGGVTRHTFDISDANLALTGAGSPSFVATSVANQVNYITANGGATGTPAVLTAANSSDTNVVMRLKGKGTSGILANAYTPAALPTTTDIPAGTWAVWKDTSGGTVKLYYNDGGTLKSVALT